MLCGCLHAMPQMVKAMHARTHTHTHTHNLKLYPIHTTNLSFMFEQLMNFEFQSCKLINRKYSCYTEYVTGWTVKGSNFGKCKKLYILENVQTVSGTHLDWLYKRYRIFPGSKLPTVRTSAIICI